MSFDAPLWLFLFIPGLAFEAWRVRQGSEAVFVRWLRRVMMTALVLALAQPHMVGVIGPQMRVLVVDRGSTMARVDAEVHAIATEEADAASRGALAVVAFAEDARPVPVSAGSFELPSLAAEPARAHAEAIQLAADLVLPGTAGEIVLVSDGRALGLAAREAALAAAKRGVHLRVRFCGAEAPLPVLKDLVVPSRVRCGQTFAVRATLDDPQGRAKTVELRHGRERAEVRRQPASGEVELEEALWEVGLAQLELCALDAKGAVLAQRDIALVVAPPVALYLHTDEAMPARPPALLRMLADAVRPVSAVSEAEVILLEDVPAESLPESFLDEVQRAVAAGTGLVVSGGRRSFGPGGWQDTALDAMLPLGADEKEERRDPSATLVFILDTSGSMQGTRMELAKEVARLALSRLKPHDKAGIVEFHGARRWAAPIQSAANAVDLQRALHRLTAGGGTIIMPAIEEAYHALLNARTRTRHLLVITDGGVESGDFESLLRRMADKGITTSTVMVGSGAGQNNFLFSLAQWGKGRFYHARDRFELPEVRVKQPESAALSPWREERTVVVAASHAAWAESLGPLDGFVETVARRGAVVDARTPGGEPLLAHWEHGRGKVLAVASTWTSPWNAEPAKTGASGRALTALIHKALPERGVQPELKTVDGLIAVRLPAGVAARVEQEGRLLHEFARGVPRSEEALRVLAQQPRGVIELRDHEKQLLAALAVDRVRPWTSCAAQPSSLSALAEQAATALQPNLRRSFALRTPLLVVALIAFLLHVAARRTWAVALLLICVQPLAAQEPELPASLRTALQAAMNEGHAAPAEVVALVQRELGDCAHALAFATQAAEGHGDRAWRLVAALSLNAGLPQRALEAIARLNAAEPADLLLRARCEEHLGQAAAARETLQKLLDQPLERGLEVSVRLRLAALLGGADARDAHDAQLKTLHGASEPAVRLAAKVLAALAGDATWLLSVGEQGEPSFDILMLAAAMALEAQQPSAAIEQVLDRARLQAPRSVDQRFVDERIMALHRRAETLPQLAERWLGTPSVQRAASLVALLRELARPAEALDILRAGTEDVADERVQRELISLALECGRLDAVEQAYRERIAAEPTRLSWVQGLVLLQLFAGRREMAVEVMDAALARVTEGPRLLQLARLASDLGLVECTARALERALGADARTALRARLMAAEQALQSGDQESARAELQRAEEQCAADATLLLSVAQAYERAAMPVPAIRLLERVVAASGAEDARMHLAWLLEQRQRLPEAFAAWREIWRASTTTSRLRHAEERLLELGSRAGLLADFAVDIEKELTAGQGSPASLQLLAKIYQRAGDQAAAVEVLREHGRRFGAGEAEVLESMARVYESCDDYARYEEAVRELMRLKPEQAVELKQQMILSALERGRGKSADRLLSALLADHGQVTGVSEFAAGVLGMVQRHQEAADAWGKVLATTPDQIEAWLLRGNMLEAAGARERALHLFLNLLEEAPKDDLFTVAADGLLNLHASPAILECALRRIHARIAASPASAYLWQLAADFEEELGRRERQRLMLTALAAVSGERRGAYSRELFELARERGDQRAVLEEGRALLALGEEFPPDVFLALGEAMLAAGDARGAERVFARAGGSEEWLSGQRAVARLLSKHGREEDAERVLRQALLARPDDVELMLEAAQLAEVHGAFTIAARDALRAMQHLCARSPGEDIKATSIRQSAQPRRSFAFLQRNQQEDLYTRFSAPALRLLLANGSARDADALVGMMRTEAQRIATAPTHGASLKDHPRLERLWSAVLSTQPVLADLAALPGLVRELQSLFPKDNTAATLAAQALGELGALDIAALCAGSDESLLRTAVPEVWRSRLMADEAALRRLALEDSALAAEFAARLFVAGQSEAARRLISELDPVSCGLASGMRAPVLALVTESCDTPTAQRWWLATFEAALQHADSMTGAEQALRVLRAAAVLMPSAVDSLQAELARRQSQAPTLTLEVLARLTDARRKDTDLSEEHFKALSASVGRQGAVDRIARVLSSKDRQRLLAHRLGASTALPRYQILNLLEESDGDSEVLNHALINAWRSARPRVASSTFVAQEFEAMAVLRTRLSPARKAELIEVLSSEAGDQPVIPVVHGLTLLQSGSAASGTALLASGLKALLAQRTPSFQTAQVLELLTKDTTEAVRTQVEAFLRTESPTSGSFAAQFHLALLQARGEREAALELARMAAKRWPGAPVAQALDDLLWSCGAWREWAESLSAAAGRNTISGDWGHAQAADAWLLLGEVDKARECIARTESETSAPGQRLALALLTGGAENMLRTWRKGAGSGFPLRLRGSVVPWWSPPLPPGIGLVPSLVSNSGEQRLLAALVAQPEGRSELGRLVAANPASIQEEVLLAFVNGGEPSTVRRLTEGRMASPQARALLVGLGLAQLPEAQTALAEWTRVSPWLESGVRDVELVAVLAKAGQHDSANRIARFHAQVALIDGQFGDEVFARELADLLPECALRNEAWARVLIQQQLSTAELGQVLAWPMQATRRAEILATLRVSAEPARADVDVLESAQRAAILGDETRLLELFRERSDWQQVERDGKTKLHLLIGRLAAPLDVGIVRALCAQACAGSDSAVLMAAAVLALEAGHSAVLRDSWAQFTERRELSIEAKHALLTLAHAAGLEPEAQSLARSLLLAGQLFPPFIPAVLDAAHGLDADEQTQLHAAAARIGNVTMLRRYAELFFRK